MNILYHNNNIYDNNNNDNKHFEASSNLSYTISQNLD